MSYERLSLEVEKRITDDRANGKAPSVFFP